MQIYIRWCIQLWSPAKSVTGQRLWSYFSTNLGRASYSL